MRKEYKWIVITINPIYTSANKKTKVFDVHNTQNGAFLGRIGWYAPFRKYSFTPVGQSFFESTCLKDIASFLEEIEAERKSNLSTKKE